MHGLQLITGISRPSRARKQVTQLLTKGIPVTDHKAVAKAFLDARLGDDLPAPPTTIHLCSELEADEFFSRFAEGFPNGWQFCYWARVLAQAKKRIRRQASTANLHARNGLKAENR